MDTIYEREVVRCLLCVFRAPLSIQIIISDYHPHCTIAYLKSGKAAKYIKAKDLVNMDIKPDKIVYSKPDNTTKNYNLQY
jgi:2'-5' RNA ligase